MTEAVFSFLGRGLGHVPQLVKEVKRQILVKRNKFQIDPVPELADEILRQVFSIRNGIPVNLVPELVDEIF